MARTALERGLVQGLPAFHQDEIKAEVTVEESRFDFRCIRDGITYYVEVKGVPCAWYADTVNIFRLRSLISIIHSSIEDVPVSPKKKADMMEMINKAENKIAYFPDGFRFCYSLSYIFINLESEHVFNLQESQE